MSTARSVAAKAAADIAAKFGGLITFPIIARYAGTDGYGAYGQVSTIVGFIIPFASLGLSVSMVRYFSTQNWTTGLRRSLIISLWPALLSSVLLTVLIAVSAGVINTHFLKYEYGTQLFRWGAMLILAGAIQQIFMDFLRAREWIVFLSALQMVETIGTVCAVAFLLPAGRTIVDVIIMVFLVKTFVIILFAFYIYVAQKPENGTISDAPAISRMIAFGVPMAVAGIGIWMLNLGDRLVIGHFMSASDLGKYNAMYGIAMLVVAINTPLNIPLYPRIMKASVSADPADADFVIKTFHRYMSIALVPACVFIIIVLKPFMVLMTKSEFGADAFILFCIAFGLALDQWNCPSQYILMCKEQSKRIRNILLGCGVFNVLLNIPLVPAFGLKGAAFTTFATYLLMESLFFASATKYMPIHRQYRYLVTLKAVAASAPGFFLIRFVYREGLPPTVSGLLVSALLFSVSYAAVLAMLGEIRRSDFNQIKKLVFGTQG